MLQLDVIAMGWKEEHNPMMRLVKPAPRHDVSGDMFALVVVASLILLPLLVHRDAA